MLASAKVLVLTVKKFIGAGIPKKNTVYEQQAKGMKMKKYTIIFTALILGGCGSDASTSAAYTCESIVSQVIQVSQSQTPQLLKIYDIKQVSSKEKELVCKGNALTTLGGDRLPVFYRRFLDEDGAEFFEYKGEPFATSAAE